ncbi:MAG: gfo/Idh/MocA family oxidoreductase [Cryomorphaceae bacterium]|nr:MAG: gfo/Idh/MocA family oxidoreductase [Cryomorphaceae bacterium]
MIKIGVVGCGHLGEIHIKLLKKSNNFDLNGFMDNDDNKSQEIEKKYELKRFYDLDNFSNKIDAVIIATPTAFHFNLAKFFIEQKKHVFIEKPIASTTEEAEELVLLVKKFGLIGQVGHVERFNSAYLNVKNLLKPMFIEAHRLSHYPERGTDVSVVLDLMIHDIDIILSIVDSKIKSINANGTKVISNNPDIVNARIEFQNGCVANLTASRISLKKMRKMRLFQPDSYISMDFDLGKSEQVKIIDHDNSNQYALTLKNFDGKEKEIKIINYKNKNINAIEEEHNNFYKSIIDNNKPQVSFEEGFKALQVAFLILNEIENDS